MNIPIKSESLRVEIVIYKKNLFLAFSYFLFGCAYGQVSEWLQTDDLAPGR